MRRFGTVLLLLSALLVGLMMPWLVSQQQDRLAGETEAAGILQVDLSVDSGLSVLEKVCLFGDPETSLLAVGVGRYQTSKTLSSASWRVLDILQGSYGVEMLQTSTAAQVQQVAYLASQGGKAFLLWQVVYEDELGAVLHLYLDDETGTLLGLTYSGGDESGKMMSNDYATWCTAAMWALCEAGGISPVTGYLEPVGMEPARGEVEDAVPEEETMVESPANYEVNRVTYAGEYTLSDGSADGDYTIGLNAGYGWLSVNCTNLS